MSVSEIQGTEMGEDPNHQTLLPDSFNKARIAASLASSFFLLAAFDADEAGEEAAIRDRTRASRFGSGTHSISFRYSITKLRNTNYITNHRTN